MTDNPCAEATTIADDPLDAVVRDLLSTVPGILVSQHRPCAQESMDMHGNPLVEIQCSGWSPTLHRVPLHVALHKPQTTMHPEVLAAETVERLRPMLDIQQERADRAAALGIDEPLAIPSDDVPPHVHVDRSFAAVLGGDCQAQVAEALRRLHNGFMMYDGGRMCMVGDAFSGELPTREATRLQDAAPLSFVGFRVMLSPPAPGRIAPTFDGVQIRVRASVPETVLSALQGRPVRDVGSFHPTLDDRIIAVPGRMEHDGFGGFVVLTLKPDPISMAEIRAAGAA